MLITCKFIRSQKCVNSKIVEFNTDSKLAGLYVIFTKAVIIGNLVDLVWRSWSEIKGIYVHVNGSIQAQLESISAKAQPFKDITATVGVTFADLAAQSDNQSSSEGVAFVERSSEGATLDYCHL